MAQIIPNPPIRRKQGETRICKHLALTRQPYVSFREIDFAVPLTTNSYPSRRILRGRHINENSYRHLSNFGARYNGILTNPPSLRKFMREKRIANFGFFVFTYVLNVAAFLSVPPLTSIGTISAPSCMTKSISLSARSAKYRTFPCPVFCNCCRT